MNVPSGLVITIDGPGGAGKSTIARKLAERLGYTVLDTGAIYRSLALAARQAGIDWSDGGRLSRLAEELDIRFVAATAGGSRVFVAEQDVTEAIRTPSISAGASEVSAHPQVRLALLALQRRLASRGGVVAEGRDTGSVVFPDAHVKLFLTASSDVRALRRLAELHERGAADAELETVRSEMQLRDRRDSTRSAAPLTCPKGALVIDSSELSVEEVVDLAQKRVEEYAARQG